MGWSGYERGASEVLGAILVFAILVSALALFQVSVVPQQNKQVEFDAYEQARADLVEVNTQIVRTAGQGTQGSATVKTGVSYPARAFAINPGEPSGTVRLTSDALASIENAEAVDPDAADYWNGAPRDFRTQRVTFQPAYNRFDGAPVAATGYLVYRLPDGGSAIPSTEQTLVKGSSVTLTAVRGDVSTAGQRVTLTTRPVSTSVETVRVRGEDTDNDGTADEDIVIEVPTELSQPTWDRILAGQTGTGPNQNVESVSVSDGVATITLDGSKTYTLQLAKVEVRERSDDPVIDDANPAYVTNVTGRRATTTDTTVTLEARVFDTFGNPVAGEAVTFRKVSGSGDGSITRPTVQTDDRGVATTTYSAGSQAETATIDAECTCSAGNPESRLTEFTVDVSAGPDAVNRPPSVEIRDIERTDDSPDEFEVTVTVRDPDSNLQNVGFRMHDPQTSDGSTPVFGPQSQTPPSDDQATLTQTVRALSPPGESESYRIVVVVVDEDGLRDSESVVVDGTP